MTIKNVGTANLNISSISLQGRDSAYFTLSAGTCGSLTPSLAPGASCAVALDFTRPPAYAINYAELQIASNDLSASNSYVTLFGNAPGAPQMINTTPLPVNGLTINMNGTGTGTVQYSGVAKYSGTFYPPATCPGACSGSYPAGTDLDLTALPSAGSVFAGWNGCDLVDGDVCRLDMYSVKNVTASFNRDPRSLTVLASPPGGSYVSPPTVTLAASKDATIYYTLDGSPPTAASLLYSDSAPITLGGPKTLKYLAIDPFGASSAVGTQTYSAAATVPLTVGPNGGGTGTITSAPAGINCTSLGGTCTADFNTASTVTLNASPDPGFIFGAWGNDCSTCSGPTCQVTMDAEKFCSASFTTPITISGVITSSNGRGVTGATVTVIGSSPSCSTTTGWDGSYSLPCVPKDVPFVLFIEKAGSGYVPLYTRYLTYSQPTETVNITLNQNAEICGMQPGKGKIIVTPSDNIRNVRSPGPSPGVVVTATSILHPSVPYPVSYFDGSVCSGSATYTYGTAVIFADDGDTVTLEASKPGWTFNPVKTPVHADTISSMRIFGLPDSPALAVYLSGAGSGSVTNTPNTNVTLNASPSPGSFFDYWTGYCSQCGSNPACAVTLNANTSCQAVFSPIGFYVGGTIYDMNGLGLSGATVQVDSNPSCSTTTTNGAYTLSCIPYNQEYVLKVSKSGYTTIYSRLITSKNSFSRYNFTLRTPAQPVPCNTPTPGKGVIFGVVSDATLLTNISGAEVTATDAADPGISYPVTYFDGYVCGGPPSAANGQFIVNNVPDGRNVVFTASKPGWTFRQFTVPVHDGAVTTHRIYGTSTDRNVSVTIGGSGGGSVSSDPAGLSCSYPPQSGTCSKLFSGTAAVTLTATATTGSFAGWGGSCSSCINPLCEMILDTDKSCTALFNRPGFAISGIVIVPTGPGTGLPLPGVTVQVVDMPACTTQTGGDGSFSLPCIPYDTDFVLNFSKPGYIPTYSQRLHMTSSLASTAPYSLFPIGSAPCGGTQPGKGGIIGLVADLAGSPLSGAVVTVSSAMHPGILLPTRWRTVTELPAAVRRQQLADWCLSGMLMTVTRSP